MSQKSIRLTEQEARKHSLVVESELNRAQLAIDWQEVKQGLEHLGGRMATVGSAAESAVKMGATVLGFFRGLSPKDRGKETSNGKRSWFSTVIDGTRAGASLWSALRSRMR